MYSDKIINIYRFLREKDDMYFPMAVSSAEIEEFERINNISLPNDFKTWLKCTDGGEIYLPAGIQFYGIKNQPLIDPNDKISLGSDYVVIGRLASGDPLIFKNCSDVILIFNQMDNKIEPDEIYSNFGEFLNNLDEILGIEG